MATLKKLGPYGCDEGAAFDIDPNKPPYQLVDIEIWSKDGPEGRINAISFTYRDEKGDSVHRGPFGTQEESTKHPISIKEGEYLTMLSGYFSPCLTSIYFRTSMNATYGPYGKDSSSEDTPFSINVPHDSIIAFFGRYDDQIRAIGAYSGPPKLD